MSQTILVMGVAGAGKSTVGGSLAQQLQAVYLEADDFHSAENKAKMAQGTPLTDEDRMPWLQAMHQELVRFQREGTQVVLACSALRVMYRQILFDDIANVTVVFLDVNQQTATKRIANRAGHFMPASLIQSQFDALEKPSASELSNGGRFITVDAGQPKEIIINFILQQLT